MMVLVAGPYRSGTDDDPARMAAKIFLSLCFVPGTVGDNRFGRDPRKDS